jgi:hypothetical protein
MTRLTKVTGTIGYLDANGQVIESVNAGTRRAVYLARQHRNGDKP